MARIFPISITSNYGIIIHTVLCSVSKIFIEIGSFVTINTFALIVIDKCSFAIFKNIFFIIFRLFY